LYESSAIFFRYDPAAISDEPEPEVGQGEGYREFLFFGDVESEYRKEGEEDVETVSKEDAAKMNRTIWEEAARGWDAGRLAGVFVCPCLELKLCTLTLRSNVLTIRHVLHL
jgi:hypothetical protein